MSVLVEFAIFIKFVKPSSSDLNAPNSNSKIIFICTFSECLFLCSLLDECCAAASQVVGLLQSTAFQLSEYSYRIIDDLSPNQ